MRSEKRGANFNHGGTENTEKKKNLTTKNTKDTKKNKDLKKVFLPGFFPFVSFVPFVVTLRFSRVKIFI